MIALLLHLGLRPSFAIALGLFGDIIIAKILINALGSIA